jgi:hypothetical protein
LILPLHPLLLLYNVGQSYFFFVRELAQTHLLIPLGRDAAGLSGLAMCAAVQRWHFSVGFILGF